jgi:cell division protein FtsB
MANINIQSNAISLMRRKRAIITIVLVVAASIFLYLAIHHWHGRQISQETRSASFDNQMLAEHNYKDYQQQLTFYANGYIGLQQYDKAKEVLEQITTNVPADKITSMTYRSYWSLYKHTGDVQNRKKYALLTAQKLKAEGQDAAAAQFESDAKGG